MYKILGLHFSNFLFLLWPLRLIAKISIQPNDLNKRKFLQQTEGKDVIFILPRMSLTDIFILNTALRKLGLPKIKVQAVAHRRRQYSLLAIKPQLPFTPISVETSEIFDTTMESILRSDPRIAKKKLLLQPVSIFWGRVPERVGRNAILKLLFPDDGHANPIQKIWIVLLHFRNIHVHFSTPIDPSKELATDESTVQKPVTSETLTPELLRARRVRRTLQIELNRERNLALGPELYDFNSMVTDILSNPETKKLVAGSSKNTKSVESEIIRYLAEITSRFNYLTAIAFERILDFVWTRIFQGIRIRNFENIAQIAKQGSVIWMPCHRSHLDYMVLSYVLKKRGIGLPHIAAGINLNFWPIGLILRRSGAFFLRRSFQGNRVYSHAFSQYVSYLLRNGFPIEFFQEGGRTRIGKLLAPKRGMLNMCVSSIIQNQQENCYLVPIYLGYEKVMEDDAYAQELLGSKKKKETLFHFVASLRNLFENYGQVDISFGEPIRFGDYWNEFFSKNPQYGHLPEFSRIQPDLDPRDKGVQDFVKSLARRVNMGVNSAATASGTAIMATILLAMSEQRLPRKLLCEKIEILHWVIDSIRTKLQWHVATNSGTENSNDYMLSSRIPTNHNSNNPENVENVEIISVPLFGTQNLDTIASNIIQSALSWKFLLPNSSTESEDVCRNPLREENLWWYRGTVFHLCAIPGIVSAILLDLAPDDRSVSEVEWRLDSIRKLWQEELYWHDNTSSHKIAEAGLQILKELEVISISPNGRISLSPNENSLEHIYFFADIVRPERELYSLQVTAALALVQEKGSFTREDLLQRVIQAHRAAFLRGAALQTAQHSQVFGRRVFDALVHVDIFRATENNHFTVATERLSPIQYFFETSVWRDFLR